jgi:hypothetical protein
MVKDHFIMTRHCQELEKELHQLKHLQYLNKYSTGPAAVSNLSAAGGGNRNLSESGKDEAAKMLPN